MTDANGLRTGMFGSQLLSEIPDSHPCYLMKGMYLLPENTPMTRRIVGNGNGNYTYNSILPDGTSLVLENVTTASGQEDMLLVNADAMQIRFTPGIEKTFSMTLARKVDNELRAVAIEGGGGGPATEIDITLSPELSLLRVRNRSNTRSVNVRAFKLDRATNQPSIANSTT